MEFNNETNFKILKNLSKTQYGLEVNSASKMFKNLTDLSVALDFSDAADEAAFASAFDTLIFWWNKLSKLIENQ